MTAVARRPTKKAGGTQRRGRPGGQFTQYRRLDRLRETLESHPAGLTLDELAQMLHVTTRSVRRYLEELDRVTELESIPTSPGAAHLWRIKPSERGRALVVRRTQAYGLLASRRVFEAMRGSALFDELDLIVRQLVQLAHRPAARTGKRGEIPADTRLEERLLYLPSAPCNYADRGEELDDLFSAVADLHATRARYRVPGRASAERLVLHPYALVLHKGRILCVALDVGAGQVRVLDFDAMSDVSSLEEERFELPESFRVDDYLDGEFGVAPPSPRTRVVVEFDARVADDVRRRKIHPSQKIMVRAADGRVRLDVTVGNVREVVRWILGFGDAAHVIEPPELADEIRATLTRAVDRYRV